MISTRRLPNGSKTNSTRSNTGVTRSSEVCGFNRLSDTGQSWIAKHLAAKSVYRLLLCAERSQFLRELRSAP
jgi:hypothetical protein